MQAPCSPNEAVRAHQTRRQFLFVFWALYVRVYTVNYEVSRELFLGPVARYQNPIAYKPR